MNVVLSCDFDLVTSKHENACTCFALEQEAAVRDPYKQVRCSEPVLDVALHQRGDVALALAGLELGRVDAVVHGLC